MKLVERYLAKNVLAAIGLVTFMLVGVQLFILFVNQLNDLGKANYGIMSTAAVVLLQTPYQVYLFFPMASLLGSLVGLGMMANHRELVVMRASGMSIIQVTIAVLKVAFILIILVTAIGELVVPKLIHMANDLKMQALNDGQSLRTLKGGLWLRHKNDFVSIGEVTVDKRLLQVTQYHFNKQHHLQWVRRLQQIQNIRGVWQAKDIAETLFHGNHTEVKNREAMTWDVPVNPKMLGLANNLPDELTLVELYQYLRIQKHNKQMVQNYQLAFWQRLAQPFTTVVMMILAIPFIFGPLRESSMGSKILTGAAVGFGFHIINRFIGPFCLVWQWPPEIAALAPTCLFALFGIYLMHTAQ